MKKTSQTIIMSKAEYAYMEQELSRLRMQARQAAAKFEQAERARLIAEKARLASEKERMEALAREALLKETLEEERARHRRIINAILTRKSERYHAQEPGEGHLNLFEEQMLNSAQSLQGQETNAPAKPEADKTDKADKTAKRKHPGRHPIPENLPRIDLIIEPEEDLSGCVKIGEEITEELDYMPGYFFVRRLIRPKYARPKQEGVVIAPAPLRVIPKGIPGPMLLAFILISKYVDHLPLYRQQEIFRRCGISINDVTINGWVKQAIQLLEVLYQRIRKELLSTNYLMADESTIKVLDQDKKGSTHQGYYWAYLDPVRRAALFIYEKGRAGNYVRTHLKNFTGCLQTDAYAGYKSLPALNGGIVMLGCWAHARRKFVDALEAEKAQAGWFLKKIQLLYAIERFCRVTNLNAQERLVMRENARPILDEIKSRMLAVNPTLTPKNPLSLAIRYAMNQWEELQVYTTDGKLEIDNNLVENSIRPIALGRKNYLFAGSHDAAQRGAAIYTLLACCKAQKINPLTYLADVLDKLPARNVKDIDDLLPWNWKPDNILRELDKM